MALLHPMVDFREQLDRMFHEMDEFTVPGGYEWKPFLTQRRTNGRQWLPAIELSETEKAFILKAEIPGISPSDLDLDVSEDHVVLKGETCEEHTEEQRNVHRSEFRFGQFYRQVRLPGKVKPDKAEAKMKDGVLLLNLPKLEEEKQKRVKIQVK